MAHRQDRSRWHLRDPQADMFTVPTIKFAAKNMPVHVDAEPIGFSPVEIRMRPRALRVLVPKTANPNLFLERGKIMNYEV